MKPRDSMDFRRALRAYCTENGLLMEEKDGGGATSRIVIFSRDGHTVRRVASLVVRKDQKEISPGFARRMLDHLKLRAEEEAKNQTTVGVRVLINLLIEWLKSWF